MKKTSKLLITGANGFTGQHACDYFANKEMDVVAVFRKSSGVKSNTPINHEICDLTKKTDCKKIINKVQPEYILHLAGQNDVNESWNHPISTMETNVMSTLYLLDSVRSEKLPCKIVIVTSNLQYDIKADKYPPHPYSLSKTIQSIVSQAWSEFFGLDIVIARPSNLIGPGHSNGVCSLLAKRMVEFEKNASKEPIIIDDTSIHRDFLDVRDAVRAYDYLLKQGRRNEIYNIASGKSHSLGDLISGYQDLSSDPIPVKIKSNTAETPSIVDISKIKTLGWEPYNSFATSLKDILHFYRKSADYK